MKIVISDYQTRVCIYPVFERSTSVEFYHTNTSTAPTKDFSSEICIDPDHKKCGTWNALPKFQ